MSKTQPFPHTAPGTPILDPILFREGMSRVAAAVHVVTTDGTAGRAGFTATAVTPVTDSPASLLVCANTAGRSVQALLANQVFCVNALSAADLELAQVFSGRKDLHGQDRFSVGEWGILETGAPVLMTGLVSFDCRLVDARIVATHHVLIGEIVAARLGEKAPGLVYRERGYHAL